MIYITLLTLAAGMVRDSPDGDDEAVNLLAVILGSVGGVVVLLFIVGAVVVLCRRRARQREVMDALKQVSFTRVSPVSGHASYSTVDEFSDVPK